MKIEKRYIWLTSFLVGLGIILFWYFFCVPLLTAGPSPDPEILRRIFNFFILVTGLVLIEISSIALANSIITQENILKNYTRARIFSLIKINPGVHFNEIVKNLNLGKGQTNWHLSYLERYNMIIRKKAKHYVSFYPNESLSFDEFDSDELIVLKKSKTRNLIYEQICSYPGITQKELKKSIEVSQSTLSYHLILLEELTLIEIRKKGRKRFYYSINNESMDDLIEKSIILT